MADTSLLERLGAWGPVFFGVGFLAPLISQSMDTAGIPAPFGVDSLYIGLAIGTTLGLIAKFRRSWL